MKPQSQKIVCVAEADMSTEASNEVKDKCIWCADIDGNGLVTIIWLSAFIADL